MLYIKLTALWLLFYFLHSLFAANFIKDYIKSVYTSLYRYYRLLYNIFNIALFSIIWLFQKKSIPQYIFHKSNLLVYFGFALVLVGLVIMAWAIKNYNIKEFIGTAYLKDNSLPNELNLQTFGLNKYVRHPIYFATIIFLTGYLLYKPNELSLIFVCCSFVYIIIGSKLEERKLTEQFGNAYVEYKKKTKMLLPFIY
ncbi:MAG: methyltransferase family protein [Bacteroidia bacterium]